MASKPKILITGITGYIGSNAADYFARAGYDIYGISNDAAAGKGRIKKADVTDASQVRAAIRSIKPDIVLHTAAVSSLKQCEKDPKTAGKLRASSAAWQSAPPQCSAGAEAFSLTSPTRSRRALQWMHTMTHTSRQH